MSDNHRNPNVPPPRKKRRWYYDSPPPYTDSSNSTVAPPPSRQETLKQREKERIENENNVLKIERKLHEYFQKTKTPYSYLDETGIYKFAPAPPPAPVPPPPPPPAPAPPSAPPPQAQSTLTSTNPFMNMTYTPFTPAQISLFSTPGPMITNLWKTNVIPFQFPASAPVAPAAPVAPVASPEFIEIRENIQHINDLIALCDKYPLSETKRYNINMKAIHAIRQPLSDLSDMIGMETIKKTIVDQILYYLQDLHIPEASTSTSTSATANDIHKVKDNNEGVDKPQIPFPNPFANPWSSEIPFEFKPTTNVKLLDDFASPTKGDFMHTVIYGPPGSGKTEVAKIIGRIFSNLGILNKKIFKKVSRNDLVAGYLGQTAIKTKDMIKASLGGVLFIDEAYSLGNTEKRDSFAKECVDTLCEALSEHKHNWMVIIAGYEKELNNCFFSLNEGLNSRFTWRFKLDAYKPDELKSIYEKQVRDYGWTMAASSVIPESWFASRMDYFTTFGRDMETLFTKTKIAHSRRVFCLPDSEKKIITLDDLENGYKLFIENPEVKERKERGGGGPYMKTLYL